MSSRPKKKPRPKHNNSNLSNLDDVLVNIFGYLRYDEIMSLSCVCKKWKETAKNALVLPNIFGFLHYDEIMSLRCVCKKWKDSAKNTLVPFSPSLLGPSVLIGNYNNITGRNYNALRVLTTALPNLQEIRLGELGRNIKYSDGEDPDEETAAETAGWTSHDIEIISSFTKLRKLQMYHLFWSLNGRYPILFNGFPLLQELHIIECCNLKWDLDMLAGMPLLRELECSGNCEMTGNIRSLRVLKDTLEIVHINCCHKVDGCIMELSDFPHLKVIHLHYTTVTGDIRDIGENDFRALKELDLPKTVYGGYEYELQRISDGHDLAKAVIHLLKHRPPSIYPRDWYAKLSKDSPDWYEYDPDSWCPHCPPLKLRPKQVGGRYGYCWYSSFCCDMNWVDPEPDSESFDYAEYIEELQRYVEGQGQMFKGFKQPPAEEEYRALCAEYRATDDDSDDD